LWWLSWLTTIGVLSFMPGDKLPEIKFTLFEIDKIVHFVLYFILVILMSFSFLENNSTKNEPFLKRIVLIIATGILIGSFIEIIQGSFIPNRAFDIFDIVANSIGTFIGMIFFVKIRLNKLKIW